MEKKIMQFFRAKEVDPKDFEGNEPYLKYVLKILEFQDNLYEEDGEEWGCLYVVQDNMDKAVVEEFLYNKFPVGRIETVSMCFFNHDYYIITVIPNNSYLRQVVLNKNLVSDAIISYFEDDIGEEMEF